MVDDILFDSQKEANRYLELRLLERAGEIKDLQLQVRFELIPKQPGEIRVSYIADFVYYDNRLKKKFAEDSKGVRTKDYIIKRKLFKWLYKDYTFIET